PGPLGEGHAAPRQEGAVPGLEPAVDLGGGQRREGLERLTGAGIDAGDRHDGQELYSHPPRAATGVPTGRGRPGRGRETMLARTAAAQVATMARVTTREARASGSARPRKRRTGGTRTVTSWRAMPPTTATCRVQLGRRPRAGGREGYTD